MSSKQFRAERLSGLRKLLEEADQFGEAMAAFFDITDADPGIFQESTPLESHEELIDVVAKTLPDVLNHHGEVVTGYFFADLRLSRVTETDLVHGTLRVADRYGSLFYFERHRVGLLCVAMGGGVMHYARFRSLKNLSPNPERN